jgi:hypothetical protein
MHYAMVLQAAWQLTVERDLEMSVRMAQAGVDDAEQKAAAAAAAAGIRNK